MKSMFTAALFLVALTSCGGGGGDSSTTAVFDGVWRGTVMLDKECELIGPPAEEVTGRMWELTVVTRDDTDGFGLRDLSAVDDLGNTYSGDITEDRATAHNDVLFDLGESDGLVETGVSNITFSNVTSSSIDVQFVNFGGSRFCSDVYLGVFERVEEEE